MFWFGREEMVGHEKTGTGSNACPIDSDRSLLELRRQAVLGQKMCGHFTEIPDDAEPGHDFQRVVGDVDLPPEETLARGSHEVVMIIVPAFAKRKQS